MLLKDEYNVGVYLVYRTFKQNKSVSIKIFNNDKKIRRKLVNDDYLNFGYGNALQKWENLSAKNLKFGREIFEETFLPV
jgi:hypothetical protein